MYSGKYLASFQDKGDLNWEEVDVKYCKAIMYDA